MNGKELWGIVLAGGQGLRLAPLVRELCGHTLPKQFAVLDGRQTLLQATIERTRTALPPARTVVVVDQAFEELARQQLRAHPGIDVVGQPRGAGTAPGLLLPLARIRARDPSAIVAVFPSDHHVPRPEPFVRAVQTAIRALNRSPGTVFLLGVAPDGPETEYGWILPVGAVSDRNARDVSRVRRFIEKPDAATSLRLLERGGLWNTFVSVGTLATYWGLASKFLPKQTALFERYLESVGGAGETSTLREIYEQMEPADFSRSVLERTRALMVVPVRDSGWSDWGSPARVLRSLAGTAEPGRFSGIETKRKVTEVTPVEAALTTS